MRIICPTCASHYEVEADKIGAAGQLVRCAQCREVWLVRAGAEARPAQVAPPLPLPRPDKEPLAFTARRGGQSPGAQTIDFAAARSRLRRRGAAVFRSSRSGSFNVVTVGAICAAVMSLLLGFRGAIVHHLPSTTGIYAAIGLPVDDRGLAIRDVRSIISTEGNKTVLTLEGTIANLRDTPTAVPNLTVAVRDEAAVPLYTWTTVAPKAKLAKGETVVFRSRLDEPPSDGRDVRVSFASPRPTQIADR